MKRIFTVCTLSLLSLSACTLVEVEQPTEEPTVVETEPVRETENVTYMGTVQPAGISIYQQGSHRLVLPGGKFILLESDSLDLNGYVNEKVNVFGALRPTVEAGGMIMRVERIELMEAASSFASVEEESSESSESSVSSESSDSSSEAAESTDSSESSSEAVSSEASSVSSASSEAESSTEPSAAFLENLEVMARQDFDAANWTQNYCSSHVGFCVPVHRNFWFKSFGATGNKLWHVELSAAPVEQLGDGPIILELRAGSKAELDGTVEVSNGKAVAYKEWTFGRHFVITGDERLETAVRYMLEHLTEFTQ